MSRHSLVLAQELKRKGYLWCGSEKTMEKSRSTEQMAVDPVSAKGVQEWEMSETSELDENEESSNDTSCKLVCV